MADNLDVIQTTKGKKKKRAKRSCVAGAPNGISCQNSAETPGVSFHSFPSDKRRPEWVRFVYRHRASWHVTSSSVLCSAHFEPECFTQRPDITIPTANNIKTKAWLNKKAVPTIDAVDVQNWTEKSTATARERRQVRKLAVQASSDLLLQLFIMRFVNIQVKP